MPTIHGEDAVLRVLDKESMSEKFAKLSLDVVGFSESDLVKFRRYIKEPYGMVLVTGPTGSGKTTTLYAGVSEIKNDEDKIITIEDPVEYQIKGITQIPVNEKKGLTFARGLRSILRHDPDKIMVGEIRDQETAQIAINAALTGHLVFTTVHANNVLDVLGRFLNMGVEPYNFVSALNCILAQRLVRVICTYCKAPVQYPDSYLVESGLNPEEWRNVTLYEGPGCFECGGTGFRGRTAIHELLDLSEHIREMILDKRPASEIKRAGARGRHDVLARSRHRQGARGSDHVEGDQQGNLHRRWMGLLKKICARALWRTATVTHAVSPHLLFRIRRLPTPSSSPKRAWLCAGVRSLRWRSSRTLNRACCWFRRCTTTSSSRRCCWIIFSRSRPPTATASAAPR